MSKLPGIKNPPNISGSDSIELRSIRADMQFTVEKTVLALTIVYGTYVGVYIASPAPIYATTINAILFLIFGTVVWYIRVQFGVHRKSHQETAYEGQANQSQTKLGSSE
ncbi:hypothetical protein [Haladaptatus sp. CMAA 1911]|uniref:hypothetical protein n=1 Tax=unclassified Haladaptatus TaxID=2622732 RepID=UPI003754D3F2